jgi:hypothetical protein
VSCLLIKCCKYFVLCLLYITDTTPWQAICISTTLKYNRSLEKHVLAHFQQTCSQIYFRFSSYLSRKPLLKRSTAFICNIDRNWIFWHRCLERQTFSTPRMYTLSPSKSIKEINYREFLKDKNALLMYTTVLSLTAYKCAPNLESLLTQQYVCVMCTLWSDNTCVFTRFYSVKNANTQLIWSSGRFTIDDFWLVTSQCSEWQLKIPTYRNRGSYRILDKARYNWNIVEKWRLNTHSLI